MILACIAFSVYMQVYVLYCCGNPVLEMIFQCWPESLCLHENVYCNIESTGAVGMTNG